jgi:hypothetical protein
MSFRRIPSSLRCALLTLPFALGCGGESVAPDVEPTGELSVAMATWVPGTGDDCSVETHNRYSTVGPDGKLYPTWHPPVDPGSGCNFGHEHGRDPRGSDLYGLVGDIPFAYANEQLDIWDPGGKRHEDHVGHKVEWANDVEFNTGDGIGEFFRVTCDVLVKLHQGTHSKDAFTNNVHELVYHIRCSDETEMHVTVLSAIGRGGEFTRSCDGTRIVVGTPTPANSPAGGGQRKIPDRTCIERHFLVPAGQNSNFDAALHESWETSSYVRTENHTLAHFDPYFQVFLPSRYHWTTATNITGRPIDACYEVDAGGDRASGEACSQSTMNGTLTVGFNDPRSRFNGVRRKVDINSNRVNNADGPNVWHSDPYGGHAKTTPFPGSVRQWIGRMNNERGFRFNGPSIGGDRYYGGPGTHAPN